MLLMPKSDWHWSYDRARDVLGISLGSEIYFVTPYHHKLLAPEAFTPLAFNNKHAGFYTRMLDIFAEKFNLKEGYLVQMALNATAIHFMLRPQMPRSWFFQESESCVYCEPGKLFQLISLYDGKPALVVVIETSLQAAQVMVLSNYCQISDTQALHCFDTIKVIHNRLQPLPERARGSNSSIVAA